MKNQVGIFKGKSINSKLELAEYASQFISKNGINKISDPLKKLKDNVLTQQWVQSGAVLYYKLPKSAGDMILGYLNTKTKTGVIFDNPISKNDFIANVM